MFIIYIAASLYVIMCQYLTHTTQWHLMRF